MKRLTLFLLLFAIDTQAFTMQELRNQERLFAFNDFKKLYSYRKHLAQRAKHKRAKSVTHQWGQQTSQDIISQTVDFDSVTLQVTANKNSQYLQQDIQRNKLYTNDLKNMTSTKEINKPSTPSTLKVPNTPSTPNTPTTPDTPTNSMTETTGSTNITDTKAPNTNTQDPITQPSIDQGSSEQTPTQESVTVLETPIQMEGQQANPWSKR